MKIFSVSCRGIFLQYIIDFRRVAFWKIFRREGLVLPYSCFASKHSMHSFKGHLHDILKWTHISLQSKKFSRALRFHFWPLFLNKIPVGCSFCQFPFFIILYVINICFEVMLFCKINRFASYVKIMQHTLAVYYL